MRKDAYKTNNGLVMKKQLVMIGYRPGRKSKMIERTTLLVTSKIMHGGPYPWDVYGSFKNFIKEQELLKNPTVGDISR